MIPLTVTLNLELDPWVDVEDEVLLDPTAGMARVERIGVLPNGTESERATVGLLIRLDDGRVVIAETTLRLFLAAAKVVAGTPTAEMEGL